MAWLEITLIVDGLVDIVTSILRRSGEDFDYDRLTETTNKVVFHVKMGMGGQRGAFAQLISMPVLTGEGWCGRRREGCVEHALRPRSGYSCHFGQRQVGMLTFLCLTHLFLSI